MSEQAAGDERHELARRARQATGRGVAEFARLLGVAHTTVTAWERGTRNPARRMRTLLRLVEVEPELCLRVLGEARAQEAPPEERARLEERVWRRVRRLAWGARRVVPLDRLRFMRGVSREEQDLALRALERRGALELTPALFPAALSPAERKAALRDPERGLLVFVELSEEVSP